MLELAKLAAAKVVRGNCLCQRHFACWKIAVAVECKAGTGEFLAPGREEAGANVELLDVSS